MDRLHRSIGNLIAARDGAVAPLVAVSLTALVAAGGLAFDYSRMASLDTELQNAADQAALAAATQLDKKAGACARAAAAAAGLLTNHALFANDGAASGTTITVATETSCDATGNIRFYQNKEKTTAATSDANARFVEVTVNTRRANFALTPIVAALNSGDIPATAFAGLGSAVCRVPPLMMCNPAETGGSTAFDPASYHGRGIRLVAGGSGGSWAPGNFGYLETGIGNGASALEYALGANIPPGECVSAESVTTKPGLNASVTDAINTRFDIYQNGLTNNCTKTSCGPAQNVIKDAIHPKITANNGNGNGNGNGNNGPNCGFNNGSNPWTLPTKRYLPDPTTRVSALPDAMGHPRDICHAVSTAGDCPGGRIGDGNWDRNTYFRVNHGTSGTGWQTLGSLTTWAAANGVSNVASISRYDVYRWEIATNQLAPRAIGSGSCTGSGGGNTMCAYAAPMCGAAVTPGPAQPDRRKATVAVVNCIASGINGSSTNVPVNKWVEVFLVEPSLARDRTSAADIYVEIIGEARTMGEGGNLSVVRRDVPYLIE